jgi:hypothetical protein
MIPEQEAILAVVKSGKEESRLEDDSILDCGGSSGGPLATARNRRNWWKSDLLVVGGRFDHRSAQTHRKEKCSYRQMIVNTENESGR